MNVVIRTDASVETGTGHVMRCLTLAEELRDRTADVAFVCRQQPGDLCDLVEQKGFPVVRLAPGQAWDALRDADDTRNALHVLGCSFAWLIVDHYGIGRTWEERLRPFVDKIMVIDDLADRPHDCDLLLDQNLYNDQEHRYKHLINSGCHTLLGPQFALLRSQFRLERQNLKARDGRINRILVFYGGTDPTGETTKALNALQLLRRSDIHIDVVVGTSNPKKGLIKNQCAAMPNAVFHCQTNNMAALMAHADLAIGAGGTTTWERCCLGLPSVITAVAVNQEKLAEHLATAGAAVYLGHAASVSTADLSAACSKLFADPIQMQSISFRAFGLVEGTGAMIVASKLFADGK